VATCERCGHPSAYCNKQMPWPDPSWLRIQGVAKPPRCNECGENLLCSDHHWESKEMGTMMCCGCMARLKREAEEANSGD
jgi:hypothetical protein